MGKDHTIFALMNGKVQFVEKQLRKYDGRVYKDKLVNVVASAKA
jgi:ribosomal protein L27